MRDKAFFDTNILVYAIVKGDHRQDKALDLLNIGGVISVQVLNEFVYVVRRKAHMPWESVGESLEWLRFLCPNPLSVSIKTHEEALRIARRYGYQIYDSVVIASALEANCDVLYSEDLQDGQTIEGRVKIRNPFL
jgi:predicted nucleic acid-binding protein